MPESEKSLFQRPWTRRALAFVLWTLIGLFSGSQSYLYYVILRQRVRVDHILIHSLIEWHLWGLMAPLIYDLALRLPFSQRRWRRNLTLQLLVLCAIALLRVGLAVLIERVVPIGSDSGTNLDMLQVFFASRFMWYLIVAGVILGASHTIHYYREYSERELKTSQLQAQLAQAQLLVLKMQLHPHFLFNTLHAISALMHRDVDIADRMLARLAELLRTSLDSAGKQEVPLRQELDFVRPYLEIEQARLGQRLRVDWAVEPEVLDARVPNLILQPLIENAIRHGVAARPAGGHIAVRARRDGAFLNLQIQDDGLGIPTVPKNGYKPGIGLANTRARLQQLYGTNHQFEIASQPGRGVTVNVSVPFVEDPGEAPAALDAAVAPML